MKMIPGDFYWEDELEDHVTHTNQSVALYAIVTSKIKFDVANVVGRNIINSIEAYSYHFSMLCE